MDIFDKSGSKIGEVRPGLPSPGVDNLIALIPKFILFLIGIGIGSETLTESVAFGFISGFCFVLGAFFIRKSIHYLTLSDTKIGLRYLIIFVLLVVVYVLLMFFFKQPQFSKYYIDGKYMGPP